MTTLRFDLRTKITAADLVSSMRRFIAWWRGCLWELMPQTWRKRVALALGRWTIVLDDECWRLTAPAGGHDELMLDPAAPDHELRERIARIAAASRERRVEAVIAPDKGLIRRLRLPAAAEGRLRSVVELQLARLSPFRAEDVRFDCRRLETEAADEIVAEAAIVPTETLDALERRLERVGLAVGGFRFEGLPFHFAPVELRRTADERIQYLLGAAAVIALALAVSLAPIMRASELEGLSAQVGTLRGPARHAVLLAENLRRAEAPMVAASTALSRPAALDILRNATEILPADVQLSDLKINGGAVRMSGSCSDAKKLVALLRRSGRFRDVATISPVGRTADGRDRFEIGLTAEASRR